MESDIDLRAAFDEIEAERLVRSISQAELARASGLAETTYHKLRRDRQRTPCRRTIRKLRAGLVRIVGEAA